MPLLNSVTTPYAEAFLQVADESQQTDEIVSQSKEILKIMIDNTNKKLNIIISIFFKKGVILIPLYSGIC